MTPIDTFRGLLTATASKPISITDAELLHWWLDLAITEHNRKALPTELKLGTEADKSAEYRVGVLVTLKPNAKLIQTHDRGVKFKSGMLAKIINIYEDCAVICFTIEGVKGLFQVKAPLEDLQSP